MIQFNNKYIKCMSFLGYITNLIKVYKDLYKELEFKIWLEISSTESLSVYFVVDVWVELESTH